MNKAELVQTVSEKAGLDKAAAGRAVDAVVEAVVNGVSEGDRVQIPGLGTFERRDRAAREGRNPQTGESMKIAATRVPGFKAAAGFKSAVAK
jgi:DNA-binding protein HU-beta